MSKSYKIIWNEPLQEWGGACEFAFGKSKTKISRSVKAWRAAFLGPVAVASLPQSSFAESLSVYNFSSSDPFEQVIYGTNNALTGSFSGITTGKSGYQSMSLENAKELGYVATNADLIGAAGVDILRMPQQTTSVDFKDITGKSQTMNVSSTAQTPTTGGTPVTTGVLMSGTSHFTQNGDIYIGRMAQRTPGDITQDVSVTGLSEGVNVNDSGVYVSSADSSIVIGSQVSNATAVAARYKGLEAGARTQKDLVMNNGTIDLNCINGIGVDWIDGGQATHVGIINVNGGEQIKYANSDL